MPRNIVVEENDQKAVIERDVELVERKGIGHPDSVADALSESVSRALSNYYYKHYGKVLHHNTDETQVVGGQSKPEFGGGSMLEPIYILLVGRATTKVNNDRIPYRTIALKAAREYLRNNFKDLDTDEDVIIDCKIGQGSVDLTSLYSQQNLSNDTSFGVGYAPFSETDKLTLETEKYINGSLKERMPEIGYDIKVMGVRNKDVINLTVAAAYVGKRVASPKEYNNSKLELKEKLLDFSKKFTDKKVNIFVNTADLEKFSSYYITVTGLSMENGDDGSVGRGNRVNGLITPYRPMSMEASAGKNPVTHVGKLYNILSFKIADKIYETAGGDIKEVNVRIVSQIGKPIDEPQVASIQVVPSANVNINKYKKEFESIADTYLANISDLTMELMYGKIPLF
ncbi:MAG: methionine adenosyltransferase [Thermoplasmata archaeon]